MPQIKYKMLNKRPQGTETKERFDLFLKQTITDTNKTYYDIELVLDGHRFVMTPKFTNSLKARCLYSNTLKRVFNNRPARTKAPVPEQAK